VERSIKDGQKTLKTAIDQLEVQIRKTAKQADVEKALKRIEGLSMQVRQMARDVAARGAARPTRRAASTAKRTAKTTARRKPATRKTTAAAAPKTVTRRAPRRRSSTSAAPAPAAEPGTPPEST
jgi:hypothetical protein